MQNITDAGMAQAVERRIGNAEVTGPTPVASSNNPNLRVEIRVFFISENFVTIQTSLRTKAGGRIVTDNLNKEQS